MFCVDPINKSSVDLSYSEFESMFCADPSSNSIADLTYGEPMFCVVLICTISWYAVGFSLSLSLSLL